MQVPKVKIICGLYKSDAKEEILFARVGKRRLSVSLSLRPRSSKPREGTDAI